MNADLLAMAILADVASDRIEIDIPSWGCRDLQRADAFAVRSANMRECDASMRAARDAALDGIVNASLVR